LKSCIAIEASENNGRVPLATILATETLVYRKCFINRDLSIPVPRLGVRLVERTTRSVAATQAGERLLERLRPLLDDYQAALDSLNDFRGRPAGTLRLTVPPPGRRLRSRSR